MTTAAIFDKYATALVDIGADTLKLSGDAVLLALRLAIGDAYDAGGAVAADLVAIVAEQAIPERSPADQRYAEQLQAQISRLNEWLAAKAPSLYRDTTDTATAVLAVIDTLQCAMAEYREQLAQLDADNAGLTLRLANLAGVQAEAERLRAEIADLREQVIPDYQNSLANLTAEIDRLTRQNAIAVDTFNSLAHSNGNGVDPTPAAQSAHGWSRNDPAWEGMTDEEYIALYQLDSGRVKFGELPIAQRTEILRRVILNLTGGTQRLTMAKFDFYKPEWMPMASGLVKVFGGNWKTVQSLAEAAPA